MSEQRFTAALEGPEAAGTWTYVVLPFNVLEAFGTTSQVKVTGTINGVPYRSSAMPRGDGSHYLVVNKNIRDRAGVARGSDVEVVLDVDTAARTVEVPIHLQALLSGNELARSSFERLPYSHQSEYVQWIVEAKKEETRQRRAERASMLEAGKRLKS